MTINRIVGLLFEAAEMWRESKGKDIAVRILALEAGDELVKHEADDNYRSQMFQEFLEDPRTLLNPDISTFVLDPLLRVNSLRLQEEEAGQEAPEGQLCLLGADPSAIYTNYAWLDLMFRDLDVPGDIIDLGAGIGRLGMYFKATPSNFNWAFYHGEEIVLSRVRAAALAGNQVSYKDCTKSSLNEKDTIYMFNPVGEGQYDKLMKNLLLTNPFQIVSAYDPLGGLEKNFRTYKEIEVPVSVDGEAKTHLLKIFRGAE